MMNLRALTTSELLDAGFTLYRRHFTGFFLLALLSQSAMLLVEVLIAGLKLNPTAEDLQLHLQDSLERYGLLFLVYLAGGLIQFAGNMLMTAYGADAYLGKIPSIQASLKGLAHSWLQGLKTWLWANLLIWVTCLFPLLALLSAWAFFFFHPPLEAWSIIGESSVALILLVLSVIPLLIVFMRLMVDIPAVCLEGKAGWSAIARSFVLVKYDPGLGFFYWGEMRLSLLLLPLFGIELLILSLTLLPFIIYHVLDAVQHGNIGTFHQDPDATFILSRILVLLTGSLILPLYVILTTLFYYDVRIRREGFDLEFMTQQLKKA